MFQFLVSRLPGFEPDDYLPQLSWRSIDSESVFDSRLSPGFCFGPSTGFSFKAMGV